MTALTPSEHLLSEANLIKQGAEAKVYVHRGLYAAPTTYYPPSSSLKPSTSPARPASSSKSVPEVVLKYRFPKTYRHPSLDAQLTKSRLSFEARALARCARAGVTVPQVLWVDEAGGVLGMEKIEGWSVREVLGGGAEGEAQEDEEVEGDAPEGEIVPQAALEEETKSEGELQLTKLGVTTEQLMKSIGAALARLHATNIIHGDLTTSNMMVRLTPNAPDPYEIVLIDFGLSSTPQFAEHFAVDLYVLERAFASTHPSSESLYAGVLEAYAKGLGEKKWWPIEAKLREVRLRGRKRDMTG